MKNLRLILPSLLLAALMASGCWLVSGQFTVSVNLTDPLRVRGPSNLVRADIDLATESDYVDHKDDLKDLADCALLGTFTNNTGSPAISLEVWMTPGLTNYTTETDPDGAGPLPPGLNDDNTRVKVWGPLSLGAGASVKIGWDQSAKLFSKPGKTALLKEVKGDGSFTLYAKGTGGSYDFTITKGVAVVVIDAGK